MTLKVFKYPLLHIATPTIGLPTGYKTLHFAYQHDKPTIWALVNPDNLLEDVDFRLYDPAILPRHARIEYFAGRTFIVTLDPAKPVIVNSSPVREIEIRNNYLIEIGDTLLRFEM